MVLKHETTLGLRRFQVIEDAERAIRTPSLVRGHKAYILVNDMKVEKKIEREQSIFPMPSRILWNNVKPECVKICPDLASSSFSYVPLHRIRDGILWWLPDGEANVETLAKIARVQGVTVSDLIEEVPDDRND